MTAQVVTAKPDASIQSVARTMAEIDSGAIPIAEDGKIIGLVTDRDIVLRVVAKGGDLNGPISAVMSDEVLSCKEEDNVADAVGKMGGRQVRRLVVYNDAGQLAGILSLGDVAIDFGAKAVGHALEEISTESPQVH
jgi:CBS domain-containing protein